MKLADLIKQDTEYLVSLEAVDAGILFSDSMSLNIPQGFSCLRYYYYTSWADKIDGKVLAIDSSIAYTFQGHLGVCAAIILWNASLYIVTSRLCSGGHAVRSGFQEAYHALLQSNLKVGGAR